MKNLAVLFISSLLTINFLILSSSASYVFSQNNTLQHNNSSLPGTTPNYVPPQYIPPRYMPPPYSPPYSPSPSPQYIPPPYSPSPSPSPQYIPPPYSPPQYIPPPYSPPPNLQCKNLPIFSATDDSFTSNSGTENAIDHNLITSWLRNSLNPWIKIYLGTSRTICGLYIAWWGEGSARIYNFTISLSNDGINFFNYKEGTSSSVRSDMFEYYAFPTPLPSALYLKVTIDYHTENQENQYSNFAGIRELAVIGY